MRYIFSCYGELLLQKQLCDLYCIGSSTLSYLIAAAPQIDSVLIDQVASDSSDVYDVLI